MTTITTEEQFLINSLPKEVQRTLAENPSVIENFLDVRLLPDLPEGESCKVFEVYYDCEESHSIYIENGVAFPNDRPINTNPKIIEIMDLDNFVFIQVNGYILCNRLNGNTPKVIGIRVKA